MATVSNLPALVRNKFKTAQETSELTFYQTHVSISVCDGLPFQLRYSPALSNKPKSSTTGDSKKKSFDPFLNPPSGLFITELTESHILVLNKFPVIADHFILATKDFKQQTDLLDQDDLKASYACLRAYKEHGEELFAFFNSGEHSGASQPHRHIQLIPVESMRSGMRETESWELLADNLTQNPRPVLPFTYFSSVIPDNPTPKQLYEAYRNLHEMACRSVQEFVASTPNCTLRLHPTTRKDESPISYNLGLTNRAMAICPRASEGLKIKSNSGDLMGPIALNGTLLGGTLLVKSAAEWDELRKNDSKLKDILHAIGIPPAQLDQI